MGEHQDDIPSRKPRSATQVIITVPDEVQPGKTLLQADIGENRKLSVVVPEAAMSGDSLVLVQGTDGQWSCRLIHPVTSQGPSAENSNRGSTPPAPESLGRISCEVPASATPGKTRLEVELDVPGKALCFTVPENAQPGDRLMLKRGHDGRWGVKVLMKEDLCKQISLHHVPTDPEEAFGRLAHAARACGAYVSPKLSRRAMPPVNMAGMVACEAIDAGEELIRIPGRLIFSLKNCREVLPEFASAVWAARGLFQDRRLDSAHAACLARLLRDAKGRLGREDDSREPSGPHADVLGLWLLWAEVLHGNCFDGHPYVRALQDLPAVRSSLEPSREGELAGMMVGDIAGVHRSISKSVDPVILGPNFEVHFFLQARLCLLTRNFQTGHGSAMVPVSDFLNHSTDPGVLHQWDDGRSVHVITAHRAHVPGEEILTSYGQRSNVMLFRIYGFTIPPEAEPCWSYVVQTTKPHEIYSRFLPPEQADLTVQLDTWDVEDSLVLALNSCMQHRSDPADFLHALCSHALELLERDADLEPALAALRRARSLEPSSASWWEHLLPGDALGSKFAHGLGEQWTESVLRVKMSEFLCLTAHLEVVDILAGRRCEEECLARAAHVRSALLVALQGLREGKTFAMLDPDCPAACDG